ncbi:propionate catabolism operon regulatory protein PrpR [Polaromonas sp. P1-6]|nr:propionate catabolism operon regulatory protein PrpR [Polaromonas sp. P1-6]
MSRPRLCFLSYRQIRMFAMPIVAEYSDRADIEVVDGSFEGALATAKERIAKGQVDVFVSAGSNASLLRSGIQAPVATIQLSGFDILQALIRARQLSDRIGIVMYGQIIPELDSVKGLLNIEIHQYAYQTPNMARQCIQQLQASGVEVIVGSSLVVELAQEAGLQGLLAYSLSSIRQGFDDALELARVARLEAGRYEQLNGVLHNLQDAVLAVNHDGLIIAVNPAMKAILGQDKTSLLGHPLAMLTPDLSLDSTLQTGREERGVVLRLAGRDWVVNRTPIREHGQITGAAITLYDARAIHEADNSLRIQHRQNQTSQGPARYCFDSLFGQSPSFMRAVQTARRYAQTDLGVLIVGESGVGKELFAQAMHNESVRARKPFVAVNCAAFPESLLESELFGYEEGAFTGSRRGGKRGLFESAHTGTLFLDEIGDMPLTLQTRLLRALQEREIMRLGSTTAIPVDVRVMVATHQPLREMVAQRRFHEDLYYRINTLRLALPALRERRTDIVPMAERLVRSCLERMGSRLDALRALAPLSPYLLAYAWPGNVRELENFSERIAVFLLQFQRVEDIAYEELELDCPELFEAMPSSVQMTPLSNHRRACLALEKTSGNHTLAAQQLGVSRSTLWRWRRKDDAMPELLDR